MQLATAVAEHAEQLEAGAAQVRYQPASSANPTRYPHLLPHAHPILQLEALKAQHAAYKGKVAAKGKQMVREEREG